MYEAVFYQTIEYVIAPIGLMIFLFYIKNVDIREKTFNPEFKENGIESLFIASYSHILYYFSVTAHADGNHSDDIIEITKSASLMSAVLGLMLIFILKYYSNIWGTKNWKSKISTNTTALCLMFFLFIVICFLNFKGWHFDISVFSHPLIFLKGNFTFLSYPNNFLFIIAACAILLLQYKLNSRPKELTTDVMSFLNLNENQAEPSFNVISNYTEIGKSNINPVFVRVDAFIANAKILLQKGDPASVSLALLEVEKAKRIALEANYPENLLYGIRKLKIEIHCMLDDEKSAYLEVSEIEKQNLNELNIDLVTMRNEWVEFLNKLILQLKNKLDQQKSVTT